MAAKFSSIIKEVDDTCEELFKREITINPTIYFTKSYQVSGIDLIVLLRTQIKNSSSTTTCIHRGFIRHGGYKIYLVSLDGKQPFSHELCDTCYLMFLHQSSVEHQKRYYESMAALVKQNLSGIQVLVADRDKEELKELVITR